MTVTSDGAVIAEFAGQQQRFRISRAEAAEFRKTLAPYRWSAPVTCEQVIGGKYPAPFSYPRRLGELKVTWTSRDGTSQLVACDTPENAALSNAIKGALKLLHLGY